MLTKIDDALIREMMLCADNDCLMYVNRAAYEKNAMRWIVRGKYDAEKAVKLWSYYADNVRHWYAKENDMPLPSRTDMLEMARRYAVNFEDQVRREYVTPADCGIKGDVPEGF
jgi:hypothetical protein